MLAGGLYERTSGAAGQPLAGYRRREPERTVLHELVARHAQTMLAEVRAADPEGGGLPRFDLAPDQSLCGVTRAECLASITVEQAGLNVLATFFDGTQGSPRSAPSPTWAPRAKRRSTTRKILRRFPYSISCIVETTPW